MINAEVMMKIRNEIGMTPWCYNPTKDEIIAMVGLRNELIEYLDWVSKRYDMSLPAMPKGYGRIMT